MPQAFRAIAPKNVGVMSVEAYMASRNLTAGQKPAMTRNSTQKPKYSLPVFEPQRGKTIKKPCAQFERVSFKSLSLEAARYEEKMLGHCVDEAMPFFYSGERRKIYLRCPHTGNPISRKGGREHKKMCYRHLGRKPGHKDPRSSQFRIKEEVIIDLVSA